jgi:hypothetical protein
MQPELVATYSWNLARKGRTHALELKVSRMRFGPLEGSDVVYSYALFADGEDVQLWQRPTLEDEQLAKVKAGHQFESWAIMMGL